MTATVRWLMAQRRLGLVLRGGTPGLDRPVDCAVTSELLSAGEWMLGGEVLLTTGLRLADEPSAWASYLRGLDDAGVAAVGLGVGFGFSQAPPEMIATADDLGLPLFEVPLPVPFSAVSRAVLDQIAAQRSSRLVAATKAQPRMTRAVTAGGSAAVVAELAEAVASSVVLLDPGLAVVASAPRPVAADVFDSIHDRLVRDPASAGAVLVTDDRVITVARVAAGGRTIGHLAVSASGALDDVARMLIGHAVSLLAIEQAKPRQVAEDLVELHDDVLALALDGDVRAGATTLRLLARAADRRGQVRAVAFRFVDERAAVRGRRRLVDELEDRWRPVFVHRTGVEVVVLLRGDDGPDLTAGLLKTLNADEPVSAGIGGRSAVPELTESVRQALLAGRSASPGQLVDLQGSRSLLTMDPIRRTLGEVYGERLAPVLDHDRRHGTSLREALTAYLEANGNWGVAAAAQGVHRHTLRHRMERVETLLEVDLTDARTRAELLLMLLAGAQA
ncbi:PucR family transcriptional regulator ligand-binding domain-containing protein [Gordonia sp. CPCC 206044]|uniref:PucR family transcriptional regulator n=1 Tax=Gordonia sp. CPCC 206044 TaxID=3140793 RepID=UPI003AF38ED0